MNIKINIIKIVACIKIDKKDVWKKGIIMYYFHQKKILNNNKNNLIKINLKQ